MRPAYTLVLSIGALLMLAIAPLTAPARAQISAVTPGPACGYREAAAASLLDLRANAKELVQRRCL